VFGEEEGKKKVGDKKEIKTKQHSLYA